LRLQLRGKESHFNKNSIRMRVGEQLQSGLILSTHSPCLTVRISIDHLENTQ
jgi:hypothetical protein